MAGLPIIEVTTEGVNGKVGGAPSGVLIAAHMTKFTAYIRESSGSIAGLVLIFQLSPDGGATWYDQADDIQAPVVNGVVKYVLPLKGDYVVTRVRVCVKRVSTAASTFNVDIMGS